VTQAPTLLLPFKEVTRGGKKWTEGEKEVWSKKFIRRKSASPDHIFSPKKKGGTLALCEYSIFPVNRRAGDSECRTC